MRHALPTSIGTVLQSLQLAQRRRSASLTDAMEVAWQREVDASWRATTRIVSYQHGCLNVTTSSATVASQFRYLGAVLVQQLKNHPGFEHLERIHAFVSATPVAEAPPVAPPKRKKPRPVLSATVRQHLLSCAEQMNDPEISEVLRRLASAGRRIENEQPPEKPLKSTGI